MRITALIVAALVTGAMTASEDMSGARQQKPDADLATLVSALEASALAGRIEDVKRARVDLLRMSAAPASGPRASLVRYSIAYAGWRMVFAPSVPDAEQVLVLEDAAMQLNEVLKTQPNDVEALSLLAAVQGVRIAKSPELGMTLGPESDQLIERAMRLAPSNPRALAIGGQSALNTPPEYGGSVSRAEGLFRAALRAFEKQGAQAVWPNWGRFDAHVWLGQTLAQKGDKAGARAEYEKALVIAPESAWVKFTLLPAVR